MGIKEKLKNNFTLWLIITLIAIIAPLCAVLTYFHRQQIERLKFTYESKLLYTNSQFSSIKIGIKDGDIKFLTFNDIFIDRDGGVPNTDILRYFSEGEFYALSDTNYWKYSSIDESSESIAQVLNFVGEITSKNIKTSNDNLLTVHNWVGEEYVRLNVGLFWGLSQPSILFQKTHLDSIIQLVDALGMIPEGSNINEIKNRIGRNGLTSGVYSHLKLMRKYVELYDSALVEIQEIYKTLDYAYIKTLTTVFVNNRFNQEIQKTYIKTELICFLTNNNLYIILIIDPSTEKLRINPEIVKWLGSFKVLTE